jgi:AcrR family transcriptional regulator
MAADEKNMEERILMAAEELFLEQGFRVAAKRRPKRIARAVRK